MNIFVTKEMVRMKAVHSSGPGGHQSANRSKKVQMWVEVEKLPLSDHQKKLVREKLAHRINKNDELEEVCQDERSQEMNRDIGIERMNALIAEAIHENPERIPTEPPRAVKREGVHERLLRYMKKKFRRESHH